MIRLAVALACYGVLMLLCHGSAAEPPFDAAKPVVEIEWRGQANLGQEEFLSLIGIQVGETVQREAIRRSIDRLYLKGFFSQIRIESAPVRGGFKLTYYTTPVALVHRYHISGNRAVSDKAILERLRPQVEERFSEHRFKVSLEALEQFYGERGLPQARVRWYTQFSEDLTRVTIVLHIEEGPALVVEDIRLEGVTAFAVAELLEQFRVKPGQPLNTEHLSGDLERLQGRYRRAGYLTIRLEEPRIERDLERQRARVTITVAEGPKITLTFVGNRKLSNQVLAEAVLIDAFSGYSEDVLVDSAGDMLERYREQGYHFATIRHHVEVSADGRAVTIRFDTDEGPQVRAASLRIIGNRELSEADIRAQLLTQPRGSLSLFSKGLFIEKQLERDLEAVQFLYRRRGFLKAEVQRDLTFRDDGSLVAIHLLIDEGPRTYVEAITLKGAEMIPESELRSQLTLQAGDPFDEGRLQEDVDRLAALYERRGYREARLTVERRLTDDARLIHLTYHIDEGQRTVVGQIIVQGNFRTQVEVIARELLFRSGDPLSLTQLLASRRKLSRLSLFSRISMDPRFADVAGEEDVLVQVVERKSMALNLGAGYGSEDKLRGFVEFSHHNINGMHRQFRARAQASFREQIYLVNFREPRLFSTLVSSTVGLSRAEERRQSFDVRRTSAQLGFEYPFADRSRAFLTYSFDLERLFAVDQDAILSEVDRGRLNVASILATLQRDTRDNIVDARSGSL